MAPENVLSLVAPALFGVVVWLVALPAGPRRLAVWDDATLAWWHLVLPVVAGGLVVAFVVGWALQESNPADERVGALVGALAVLSIGVVLRALGRAAKALRLVNHAPLPIGTVGILRPRVVVSEDFRQEVSQEVLNAALAHERAHARHRDPVRIWLAQLAADLQWPIAAGSRRFANWVLALEAARDDEAVSRGTDAGDLAEAILVAARLQRSNAVGVSASAAGAGEAISWRVRRLLSSTPLTTVPRHVHKTWAPWAPSVLAGLLVLVAIRLGVTYGDAVLRALPGVGP